MKHLAVVQTEFLKEARKWSDLSFEQQKDYMTRHPGSKRRLTRRGRQIRKKDRRNPCCGDPKQEYHSSWQDETGMCANCGKPLRHGNGPLNGKWPKGSIKKKKASENILIRSEFFKIALSHKKEESNKFYDEFIKDTALLQEARRKYPNYPEDADKEAEWIVNKWIEQNPEAAKYKHELYTSMLEGLI